MSPIYKTEYLAHTINFQVLKASYANTCFISRPKGSLNCWGDKVHDIPAVPSVFKANTVFVDMGSMHACAISLKTNRTGVTLSTQVCWGNNLTGVLDINDDWTKIQFDLKSGRGQTCGMYQPNNEEIDNNNVKGEKDGEGQNGNKVNDGVIRNKFNCQGHIILFQSKISAEIDLKIYHIDLIDEIKSNVSEFCVGYTHFIISKNYDLQCQGDNLYGQCEIPITYLNINIHNNSLSKSDYVTDSSSSSQSKNTTHYPPIPNPTLIPTQNPNTTPTSPADKWTSLSAGNGSTCGLLSSILICWGLNNHSQTTVPLTTAYSPLHRPVYQALVSGDSHHCAVTMTGFECWGHDKYGQAKSRAYVPVLKDLVAGGFHNCMSVGKAEEQQQTDHIRCWGNNSDQQCLGGNNFEVGIK